MTDHSSHPNPAKSQLMIDPALLSACVHCGLCLPSCPTYRVTGSEAESPRGRLYLMSQWMDGRLEDPEAIRPHLDQCLACHACETVCPAGVQYGNLLFQARETLAQSDHRWSRFFKRGVFQWILPNFFLLGILRHGLTLYQRTGLQPLLRKSGILNALGALKNQEALLPDILKHQSLRPGMRFGNPANEPVALMTGCVMDMFFNPVHWATIYTLLKQGYFVTIPEQTCCGALAHHAGEVDIAKDLALQNIEMVQRDHPTWIALNSAGCGSTLRHYGEMLPDNPKALAFSSQVIDVMSLLSKKPLTAFDANQAIIPQTVAYHAACHLYHVQKVTVAPQEVLAQIPGITVVPLSDLELCCGSAGIYNIEHAELADEILDMKMRRIEETMAKQHIDTLVSGNPGCLIQLGKGLATKLDRQTPIALKHPIEILAAAYGYEGVADVMALRYEKTEDQPE